MKDYMIMQILMRKIKCFVHMNLLQTIITSDDRLRNTTCHLFIRWFYSISHH